MKKLLLIGLLIIGLQTSLKAAEIALDSFLFETISVGTQTVATGTSTLTSDTTLDKWTFFEGMYTVEGGSIRYRTDGGNPTDSVGHVAATGTSFIVNGLADCRNWKAITASGTQTVQVTYKRK